MDEDSNIRGLLADERDLSRTVTLRLFSLIFASPPIRVVGWALVCLSAFLIGAFLIGRGQFLGPSPLVPFIGFGFGMVWLPTWFQWRRLSKVKTDLAACPANAVERIRQEFAQGGVIAPKDWDALLVALVIAALLFLCAWEMWRAGQVVGAGLVALAGVAGLVTFAWKVRPWRDASDTGRQVR